MSGRERVCGHCGKRFLARRASAPGKTCSYRCMGLAKRTLPAPTERKCLQCSKTFVPRRKYQQQKYCSHKCQFAHQHAPDFNARLSRESAEKRSEALRYLGGGKTYRKYMGRHEHRVVAESLLLHRPLADGEVVRFKDGDLNNTDPSNLEVLPSQAEHARLTTKARHAR